MTTHAATAIEESTETIVGLSDRRTTIASAVEERTITTSEITRSVSEPAAGPGEITSNIPGVSTAANSTTDARGQTRAVIAELTSMATDLRAIVSRFIH